MAVSFNKVILAGNLTRDPQVRFLANEKAVANFGLAINRRYKKGEETVEEVTFVDITAWGKTAELCGQYLTKGRACLVEGSLRLESWDDKDGNKRQKLVVVADGVQFLSFGDHKNEGGNDAPAPSPKPRVPTPAANDDQGPPF